MIADKLSEFNYLIVDGNNSDITTIINKLCEIINT